MLQAIVGNTTDRRTLMVTEDTTLAQAIDMAAGEGVVFDQTEMFTLNGTSVKRSRGDLDHTFGELGITGRAYLASVKNSQNATC